MVKEELGADEFLESFWTGGLPLYLDEEKGALSGLLQRFVALSTDSIDIELEFTRVFLVWIDDPMISVLSARWRR